MPHLILVAISVISPSALANTDGFKDNAWWYVLGFIGICGLIGFGQLLTLIRGPRKDKQSKESHQ